MCLPNVDRLCVYWNRKEWEGEREGMIENRKKQEDEEIMNGCCVLLEIEVKQKEKLYVYAYKRI